MSAVTTVIWYKWFTDTPSCWSRILTCTRLYSVPKKQVEIFNFCFQGVLKVRKRVTLMVITVSIIFGVTWLADSFNFVLHFYKPSFSKLTFATANIFILFNSAINPILYALINQRFKEKMKGILSGKCRAEPEGMFSVKKHEKVEIAVISFHQLTDERSWGSDFW